MSGRAVRVGRRHRPRHVDDAELHIDGSRLTAWVDGGEVLSVSPTLIAPTIGQLGLFVDIGTEAYFSNFRITSG